MDKLTIKHLAAYLPYELKIQFSDDSGTLETLQMKAGCINQRGFLNIGDVLLNDSRKDCSCKPILRPLSDLTKEIEHNGVNMVFIDYISVSKKDVISNMDFLNAGKYDHLRYWQIEKLFEMHYDVFDLIPNGLAIDINTIK